MQKIQEEILVDLESERRVRQECLIQKRSYRGL